MIPVKLELYNFLAYREPEPIDLTGLHVACLAGANGAGKSSLLDAITWALWGKARTRRDDELIHIGQTEMQVALTFQLGDNLYRVLRHRSSQGSGRSMLTLDIWHSDDWHSISEPTIRATQNKIDRTLRLDYQTFINSAFLVQGRADEFTNKTPGERKAILSEILGLSVWEHYEDKAKRHLQEIKQQQSQLNYEIDQIDQDLGRREEYQAELIETQQALDTLTGQLREVEERYRELDGARRERESVLSHYQGIDHQLTLDEKSLEQARSRHEQQQQRLEFLLQLVEDQAEIESGYLTLQEARQRDRELNDHLLAQNDLRERLGELQQAINSARSHLEAEKRQAEKSINKLEGKLAEASEEPDNLQEAQEKISRLEALDVHCNELRERRASLREELASLDAQNNNLKAEMKNLARQRDDVEAVTEPVCPLCGQELSDTHRIDLLEKLETRGNQRGDLWRANQEEIERLKAELVELDKELKKAEPELRNLPPLRDHFARLSEQSNRTQEAQAELEALRFQLADLETALADKDYAHVEQGAAEEIEEQLAELGYDGATHREIQATIDTYQPYEKRKAELEHALEEVPKVEISIEKYNEELMALEGRVAESQDKRALLADKIKDLDKQLVDFDRIEQEVQTLRDEEADARVRVGAADQRLNALQGREARRIELVEQLDQYGEEYGIYHELRLAFGKDGIPAMIIEMAIPEIEQEANQILTAMTDGQMHVRFDTQREKVTGGTKETLDINISDGRATRDYATFSGGEAFRVNFAIRLALSRLLARRAGAQLRTLIIDEGFGSQDNQGRERLVQAIHAIQDEFDLILVITHIEELKEAFPVRLEITKTPDGSVIEVV